MQVPDIINFKIIVIGHQGVGKSSLVARYIKGEFLDTYHVTVGVQYATKVVSPVPGRQIRLQIWDTAGQELFRSLVKSFYKGISAVFFVYSVDSLESFQELQSWGAEVKEYAHEEAVMFLVAAKGDIDKERREVKNEQAQFFLKEIQGAFFIETSAKTGLNIELLFKRTAEILYKKYEGSVAFRKLVNPNEIGPEEGRNTRADSLYLRRSTLQKDKMERKKKCCE